MTRFEGVGFRAVQLGREIAPGFIEANYKTATLSVWVVSAARMLEEM